MGCFLTLNTYNPHLLNPKTGVFKMPVCMVLSMVLTHRCSISPGNFALNVRIRSGNKEEREQEQKQTMEIKAFGKAYFLVKISRELKGRLLFAVLFKCRSPLSL